MLKRQLIQLSSGAILICVLACGPAAEPPQSVEEPSRSLSAGAEEEVGKFLDSYRLAIEARDSPRLRTMYVDDGRFEWIEDGEIRYRSPDEVLATRPQRDPTGAEGHCQLSVRGTTLGRIDGEYFQPVLLARS